MFKLFGAYQIRNEVDESMDADNSSAEINEEIVEETENELESEVAEEEDVEASSDESEHVENSSAETEEELEEEIEQAIEDGATEEEVKSMIKKFNLKVNGKEKEVEIDLSDEEAVKRELQKSMAFTEKAKEAKQLKDTYEQALQELLSDPISALRELGVDVDELSSQHILKQIEEEKKSPEQKQREEEQRQLAEYKRKIEEMERREKELEEQKKSEALLSELQRELDDAWDKTGAVIPKNPEMISRVADALDWAESQVDEFTGERLYPDVTIEDVLPLVQEAYFDEMQKFISNTPEDYLEKMGVARAAKKKVAEQVKKKVVPKNVSNLKKETASAKQAKVGSTKKAEPKKSSRDFFRELAEQYPDIENYE